MTKRSRYGLTMVSADIEQFSRFPLDNCGCCRIYMHRVGSTRINRIKAWPYAIFTGKRVHLGGKYGVNVL